MDLAAVCSAAAQLLDACEARLGAADEEWVVYDQASKEAVLVAAAALEWATEEPAQAGLVLDRAAALLGRLPVPTARLVFQQRLMAELVALGLVEWSQKLQLVA